VFVSREWPNWYLALGGYGQGLLNFKGGHVGINTGKNWLGVVTHRFGTRLTPNEAHEIVGLVLERFPQFRYNASTSQPVA
jgi:hypothetical protein